MRLFTASFTLFVCLSAHAQMTMNMSGPAASLTDNVLRRTGSGTSLEPASSVPPMLMKMTSSNWMLMLHGVAIVADQQQTGPRAHDKLFSANWIMPMAQRSYESGQLTLRAMFSLEPATISGRYYPELFQQGETAFGKPIVDGQHPHNLFMEIAAIYDQKLGYRVLASIYAAPVGDPALGPEAYPHRASAAEDPLAPLSHHLQDSTHIAWDVLTGGIAANLGKTGGLRLEASGFHGREPDENRWHIEVGALDSWSARLSIATGGDWLGQYSLGHLHSPEAVHPDEDVLRQTASVSYHHNFGSTGLNAIAVWGRNHTVGSAENANGYLAEATLSLDRQHLWTRIENADRTTDLLGPAAPLTESVVGRVQAYTGGYAHRVAHWSTGTAELGAQLTGYHAPEKLAPAYGNDPWGVAVLLKLQLGRGDK